MRCFLKEQRPLSRSLENLVLACGTIFLDAVDYVAAIERERLLKAAKEGKRVSNSDYALDKGCGQQIHFSHQKVF